MIIDIDRYNKIVTQKVVDRECTSLQLAYMTLFYDMLNTLSKDGTVDLDVLEPKYHFKEMLKRKEWKVVNTILKDCLV